MKVAKRVEEHRKPRRESGETAIHRHRAREGEAMGLGAVEEEIEAPGTEGTKMMTTETMDARIGGSESIRRQLRSRDLTKVTHRDFACGGKASEATRTASRRV